MLIDVPAAARLRAKKPVDIGATLAPLLGALGRHPVDLSRLRVVCDWVQYAQNFRAPVEVRPLCVTEDRQHAHIDIELAVDIRQCRADDVAAAATAALDAHRGVVPDDRCFLEDWTSGSTSLIWDFNGLYWRDLHVWEEVTGQLYEQALPGGQSDARNVDAARELITSLFEVWDELAMRRALPTELFVVELGVGNGNQARVWLDEFAQLDAVHGRNYYSRLHYLMCDYSAHVLTLARANVAAHAAHVSSLALDATTPTTALGFLKDKVFLAYISNVYDNLPKEEVARIGDQVYRVEVRAHLSAADAERIATDHGMAVDELAATARKLLRLGPALLADALPARFPDLKSAARFWQEIWKALRLAERYVPVGGLDVLQIAPGINGTALRSVLEDGGDIRMQVSNGAVASFADTLTLLHPYGRLQCHDIFVTEVGQYREGFHGPGKYDGSVVNWVNGTVLAQLGQRAGFEVAFERFAHRTGTNITTLIARARD